MPMGQTIAQPPQLSGSLNILHTPLQSLDMLSQAQVPFWQVLPLLQVTPQPPQLVESKCGSTQRGPLPPSSPPQQMAPLGHVVPQPLPTQLPPTQDSPVLQAMLQSPQLSWSDLVST